MAPVEGIANWTAGVLGLRSTVNDKCGSSHKCVHDLAPRQVGHCSGKTLRMCSCPVRNGAVVGRSIDGRLRGPPLLVGGLLGGSLTRRKLLILWRLHGDEP